MADEDKEPNDELDQFTELTRKLLTVSKEDLDKQRESDAKAINSAQ